ncbi:MAG: hypothetical protein DRP87_02155 [Spirochaetes bacterium]|nr:MAG: hypothetical protein DRP87_02155 [Spirochaetota bacterium]
MSLQTVAEKLFKRTIALITGFDSCSTPLGGIQVEQGEAASLGKGLNAGEEANMLYRAVSRIFHICVLDGWHEGGCDVRGCSTGNRAAGMELPLLGEHTLSDLQKELLLEAKEAKEIFCRYYSEPQQAELARKALEELNRKDLTAEKKAEIVSKIWVPELSIPEEEILARWKLTEVKPAPDPIKPTEVAIQLNALYTIPDEAPEELEEEASGKMAKTLGKGVPDGISGGSNGLMERSEEPGREKPARLHPGKKLADYDHPVPLFEKDEQHELLNCLDELDRDLAFEKEMGVLPEDHRVMVILSISVTHEGLDEIAGKWIKSLLCCKNYRNIRLIMLTEDSVRRIKEMLLGGDLSVYSVFGKYAVHFNALKYTQLLLGKAYGIRAGFKLDTDEGIRSRDLYMVSGKTWFQTLCHELWGGTARDWKGREVTLAVNEGEYINQKDIERLGYEDAFRKPDVAVPTSFVGEDIFFNKKYAHGKATALYNKFEKLSDHISHPVVKGGGYGITNDGLRDAVPFAYSQVGRAEDQQFYATGLHFGIRGIFHPDLRIAHYKGKVASAEKRTETSRFLGDMYRLILFTHLTEFINVKEEIDPMPGIFASRLARAQVFFRLLHRSLKLLSEGRRGEALYLLTDGRRELRELRVQIDGGFVRERWMQERAQWEEFVRRVNSLDESSVRNGLKKFLI